MATTALQGWIDEHVTWGLWWTFNAPMTPKQFEQCWDGLSEVNKLEYVFSLTSGKPFPWPARQMPRRKPKKRPIKPHRVAMMVIDQYIRH